MKYFSLKKLFTELAGRGRGGGKGGGVLIWDMQIFKYCVGVTLLAANVCACWDYGLWLWSWMYCTLDSCNFVPSTIYTGNNFIFTVRGKRGKVVQYVYCISRKFVGAAFSSLSIPRSRNQQTSYPGQFSASLKGTMSRDFQPSVCCDQYKHDRRYGFLSTNYLQSVTYLRNIFANYIDSALSQRACIQN